MTVPLVSGGRRHWCCNTTGVNVTGVVTATTFLGDVTVVM